MPQSFEAWVASQSGAYRKEMAINESLPTSASSPHIWWLEAEGETDIPLVWDLHEVTVPADSSLGPIIDYGTGKVGIALSFNEGSFVGGLVEANPAVVFLPVRDMTNPL